MDILQQIEHGEAPPGLTIWALGGPSLAIRTPETLVYLDLFTGPSPVSELHKATTDLFSPADIQQVDAAISTHHDLDHCHEDSLKPLHANTDALFIGPRSCHKLYRKWGFSPVRTVEMAANWSFQLKDLRITAVDCNDYFDANAVSYILQSGGVTVFDGGDTLYYSGYIEIGKRFNIDAALINFARNPPGEIYYMNHAHVARTAEELQAGLLVPKHYDLWEEFLEDPEPLAAMLEPKGIPVKILAQGEKLVLPAKEQAPRI